MLRRTRRASRTTPVALVSGLVGLVAATLVAASPAAAAPTPHEGTTRYLFGEWCVSGIESVTVATLGGLIYDDADPPRVGDVVYGYVEVSTVAEACLPTYALPEIRLLPGEELAISPSTPIRCRLWDYTSGSAVATEFSEECPTTPSPPVNGGHASLPQANGDLWEIPYQYGIEIQVPIRLTASGYHSTDFPTLVISGDQQEVLTPAAPLTYVSESGGGTPTPTSTPTSGPTASSPPTGTPTSTPTDTPTTGTPTGTPTDSPTSGTPTSTHPPLPEVTNGRIVFQSSRAGNPHIFSVDADGTDLRQLTSSGGNLAPAVSPDGTRIAWVRDGDLWTMAADGSDQRRVTSTGVAEQDPTWSPDGTRLAFASTAAPDGGTDLEILTLRADGTGDVQQVTRNTAADRQPDWSTASGTAPDGLIALSRSSADGGLVVVDPTGANERNLTRNQQVADLPFQGDTDHPDWHPDGTTVAFTHAFEPNAGGLPAVWTVGIDGGGLSRVSRSGAVSDSDPAWSPDGARIAYVRADGTDRDIALMAADGSGAVELAPSTAHDIAPGWLRQAAAPTSTATPTMSPPSDPSARVRVADKVDLRRTKGKVPVRVDAAPIESRLALTLQVRRNGGWKKVTTTRRTLATTDVHKQRLRVSRTWRKRLAGDSTRARVILVVTAPDGAVAKDRDRFRVRG